MPGNPTITTFNNQTPPWQLSQLDANFASIAGIINSANNYTNYLPDTGVANSYAVTFPAGIAVTITANLGVWFKAANTNTGASTLNINSTGAKSLVTSNGSALSSGMIAAGGVYFAIYDGTNYQLANPTVASIGATPGVTSRRQTVLIGPTDISGMPSLLPQSVTGLNLTTQNIIPVETTYTANVTTPVASPGVVTWTGHTLVANQAVSFTTNGALPTGLTAGVTYYVLNPATNTFNVSATPGGSAINFTGSTSGQSVAWGGVQNVLTVTAYAGNDGIVGEINLTGLASANITWAGLTNNTTNYLYVLVSPNGVLTPAFTTLAPIIVYGSVTAPSTTAGQITTNVTLGESYLGNGTTAVETPLVVIGTATTSAGNITATQVYNYGKPQTFTGKKSGTLLRRTVYNTAGTFVWIKSAQTTGVNVKVKGGGAPGGTANSGGSAWASSGGGGGEGGYSEGFFDASTFNIQTITLALGGTSSFGALISATAGATGANGTAGAGAIPGVSGGVGGTGTGGDINIQGQQGGSTWASPVALPTSLPPGGFGGGVGGGQGAPGQVGATAVAGTAGVNGGGGGGAAPGTGASLGAGGAGSVGWIVVEEYA